ncbi:MAG: replication initiation protein, partial [Ralstonia sp.]|nr:replication initiation protein [Ralstonia sp.]
MVVEEDKPVAYSEPALAERNVTMSNALTRAAHSPTLAEKRLIAACIAKNDSIPFVELRREGA